MRFPVGRLHEDEFTTPYLCENANSYLRSHAVLYAYYQREGSIVHEPFSRGRLDGLEAFTARFDYFHKAYNGKYDALIANSWIICCKNILHDGFGILTRSDAEWIEETSARVVRGFLAGEKKKLKIRKRARSLLSIPYIKKQLVAIRRKHD